MKKDLISQFKRAVSIVKLDDKAIAEVSSDTSALKWGLIFLLAPALLNWFIISAQATSYFTGMFSRFFFWPLFLPPLAMGITFYLMSLITEKFFHGKKDHLAFVRPILYAAMPLILTVALFGLSMLGILKSAFVFELWSIVWWVTIVLMFVVAYKMLKSYHHLHKDDHITVMVIGVLGYFLVGKVLSALFMGSAVVF
ncbi:hypothetical protein HN709_04250 [Candidatus Peregrinibacteria bacterium]|jgi:hypothetical protein|nr:hypothetical protein [candidate division WWE3 bacterium]MBT7736875.1 hypothetical protein [Candidatus Peregrinibacteria bacterium]